MSFLRRKNSRLLEKRLLKLRDLPFGFFAVYDFFDICFVDPFFGKAAVTADVPIDVDRGKDRAAGHDVVAGAVRTGVAVDPDDIAGAALGTGFGVFHAENLLWHSVFIIRYLSKKARSCALQSIAFSEEVCYIGFMNLWVGVWYRDQDHVHLFGKYLPQSHGGICDEGLSA